MTRGVCLWYNVCTFKRYPESLKMKCNHNYMRVATNAGFFVYKCSKCGKEKLKCMMNELIHPYVYQDKINDLLDRIK